MLSRKKKIIILSVMAVLLVVTGYLNIALNNNISQAVNNNTNQQSSASFFADYRTSRVSTRNQEIDYLNAIIASETASEESKKLAEEKKMELVQTMEAELVMEGLIKAAGFDEALVTSTSTNINVIVKSSTLDSSQVSQIVAIIKEQTGKDIDNIKIFPVE